MNDHASISPSALERHSACPGHLSLIRKLDLPPAPSSPAAEKGTRCHEYLEQANLTGKLPEIADPDERRLVELAWPYFRDHPARTGGLWLPEQRVEISKHLEGLSEDLCWGTADVVAAYKDTLEVIDAKFGFHPVQPDTPQLRAYGYGAPRLLINDAGHWLKPEYKQLRNIQLTIVQPQDREVVKTTGPLPLVETLERWREELVDILTRVTAPDAPLAPGDHCRWCAAKDHCPARREAALTAVQTMFEPVLDTDQPINQEKSLVAIVEEIVEKHMTDDPNSLDGDTLGRIIDLAPLVQTFLNDCQRIGEERLMAGAENAPAGWKLVAGRGSREWAVGEKDVEKLLKSFQVKVGDMYTKKLVSPAQAEKLPSVVASKQRQQKLSALIAKKDGKPQLAPESDPKPAVDPKHREMFEKVEEEYSWL